MNTLLTIIMTTLTATTAMTLFSYTISIGFRELYKEPVLLGYSLKSLNISLSQSTKTLLGWIFHYIIGLLFVIGYHLVWYYGILEQTWLSGLILGAISGIIGIVSWVIIFNMSKYVPNIDFKGYYLQLFFAHVIFGLVAFGVYTMFLKL